MNLADYFAEPAFWLGLVVLAIVYWSLDEKRVLARHAILVVVSVAVVLRTRLLSVASAGAILIALLWMLGALRRTRSLHAKHPTLSSLIATAPLLASWVVGRFCKVESITPLTSFVGISFLVVKGYSFAKDVVDGAIESPSLLRGFGYLAYFPALPSGPMHTYREFEQTIDRPVLPNAAGVLAAAYRLAFGLFKMKVLAPACVPFSLLRYDALSLVPLKAMPIACVGYAFVLYFDFSGISDIVIAVSAALGIRVPENFDLPYLAPNVREFWQRWHATFTRALTGYIFNPISRALHRRGFKPRTAMIVAYAATFGFCGFWHGARIGMVLWGLYHAGGLIAYDLVRQRRLRARRGPRPKSRIGSAFGVAATFAFVSLGWALFGIPLTPSAAVIPVAQEVK